MTGPLTITPDQILPKPGRYLQLLQSDFFYSARVPGDSSRAACGSEGSPVAARPMKCFRAPDNLRGSSVYVTESQQIIPAPLLPKPDPYSSSCEEFPCNPLTVSMTSAGPPAVHPALVDVLVP